MLNAVGSVFLLLVFKVSHSPADAGARARTRARLGHHDNCLCNVR